MLPPKNQTHNKETTIVNCTFILMIITLFLGITIALLPVWERNQYQTMQEKKLDLINREISRERETPLSAESKNVKESRAGESSISPAQSPVEIPVSDEIGILRIDKINMKLPIVAGVSEEQLKTAEGWVTQTAPIGEIGNAVIAGHRSYTYGRHFNRLGELD